MDDRQSSVLAKSLCRLQVVRQVLTKIGSIGHAIDWTLLLDHRKLDRGAGREMIENLLGSPAPGMMLAHERASSIDRALIVRIASILIENFGKVRTVRQNLTERVRRQDRLILATARHDTKDTRPGS